MNLSFWQGKRVLVTGGSGFIGRWVGRALAPSGGELHIVDFSPPVHYELPYQFHGADLRDLSAVLTLLEQARPEVVIHLAGQPGVDTSHADPVGAFEANAVVTLNILEACRRDGRVRGILAASSNHVYGEQHSSPTAEDAPLNGEGTYAGTKICGDILARTYGKTYELPVTIARLTNSYGGDDHHVKHIITASILSALRGEPPIIKASGRDRKGFLYVKDTADGLLRLAQAAVEEPELRGEAFNLVAEPVAVTDLVRLVLKVVGSPATPEIMRPDHPFEQEHLDGSKIQRLLGWSPAHTLEAGLRETVAWYRNAPRAAVAHS